MSTRTAPPISSFALSAPQCAGRCDRSTLPLDAFALPKLPLPSDGSAWNGTGLRTPPADSMSAAYHPGILGSEHHNLPNGHSNLVPAARSTNSLDSRASQYPRSSSQMPSQRTQGPPTSTYRPTYQPPVPILVQHNDPRYPDPLAAYPASNQVSSSTQYAIKPQSPESELSSLSVPAKRDSETLIHHSLRIPKCISRDGGSITDLAARMTCLFWFENVNELSQAETLRSRSANSPVSRLPRLAKPDDGFLKWTHNVLATTQVTQNVILLALLFIYRLKMSTPRIKGRGGSEFRLLTVALMLGNKFLDDNTYTNKTWAEVSGFSVQDIHVMEVEFLNNLRYNLLATRKEWDEWLEKLASFHEYYNRALALQVSPAALPTPITNVSYSPTRLSPVNSVSYTDSNALAPVVNRLSPVGAPQQFWPVYQHAPSSPLDHGSENLAPPPSKRSLSGDIVEPPPKRLALHHPRMIPSVKVPPAAPPALVANPTPAPQPAITPPAYPPLADMQNPDMLSLPPLEPAVRHTPTVYQLPGATSLPPHPGSKASLVPAQTAAAAAYSMNALPNQPSMGYRTPRKHRSPTSMSQSFASSPLAELAPGSVLATPLAQTPYYNSPSAYLEQRTSPYRPIRHVHHLGQATSLDQYHLGVPVQPTQMHYQPLGRRDDVRSGVVPEFLLYHRQAPPPPPPPPSAQDFTRCHY